MRQHRPVPAVSISIATDAAVQTQQDQLGLANFSNVASTVADEVEVATTLLNLATDSNSFIDEGIYSDSEVSGRGGHHVFLNQNVNKFITITNIASDNMLYLQLMRGQQPNIIPLL